MNKITGNREEILSVAEAKPKDAEGANLEQANPDESLRQKDPVLDKLWKIRSLAVQLQEETIPTV